MDRLYGEYDYTFEDVGRAKGMEWVQKYLRMKNLIVFKLSHDVLQVCPMHHFVPTPLFTASFISSSTFTTTPSSSSHHTDCSLHISTSTTK